MSGPCPRTTFYKHYQDKYDLLEQGIRQIFDTLVAEEEHMPPCAFSAEHPPALFDSPVRACRPTSAILQVDVVWRGDWPVLKAGQGLYCRSGFGQSVQIVFGQSVSHRSTFHACPICHGSHPQYPGLVAGECVFLLIRWHNTCFRPAALRPLPLDARGGQPRHVSTLMRGNWYPSSRAYCRRQARSSSAPGKRLTKFPKSPSQGDYAPLTHLQTRTYG